MKKSIAIVVAILLSVAFTACKADRQQPAEVHRLKVVTTLFPLYDFANRISGGKADVALLLPPGVEAHDFEPKPKDLAAIQDADIFVYTGGAMEPWVQGILKGIVSKNLAVVDASRGITLRSSAGRDHDGHEHRGDRTDEDTDPHIWLDFANAQLMVGNILRGFIEKDPQNGDFYRENAGALNDQLRRLDDEYRQGLSDCKTRFFLYGGHFAFNYLAKRYNLTYISVHGVSPNAEPSPAHLVDMIDKMRRYHLKYIFFEALTNPRMAETIARETGAGLLPLSSAHNVTKEQIQQKVSFIDIMKENLSMLRKGLRCR